MTTFWTRTLITAILTATASGACLAQSGALPPLAAQPTATQSVALPGLPSAHVVPTLPGNAVYDGGTTTDAGITLSAWGGGAASQDDAHFMQAGKHSILIESPGFFEGGTVTFTHAIPFGNPKDTTKYVEFAISLKADPKYPAPVAAPDTEQMYPGQGQYNGQGQGGGQYRPMPPMPRPMMRTQNFNGDSSDLFKLTENGTRPGGGSMEYPRPGQMPGQPGINPNQTTDEQAVPLPPAKQVHFLLTFSDGTQTDIARDVTLPQDPTDWFTVAFPVAKLGLNANAGSPSLVSLSLATDSPCLVNVGQVKLVLDNSPIQASTGGEKDVAVNDPADFTAECNGGASTLSYQWDFDTKTGFVPQAQGAHTTHTYEKSGVYKVTLVVSDVDGIKAPVTTTSTVHVEE